MPGLRPPSNSTMTRVVYCTCCQRHSAHMCMVGGCARAVNLRVQRRYCPTPAKAMTRSWLTSRPAASTQITYFPASLTPHSSPACLAAARPGMWAIAASSTFSVMRAARAHAPRAASVRSGAPRHSFARRAATTLRRAERRSRRAYRVPRAQCARRPGWQSTSPAQRSTTRMKKVRPFARTAQRTNRVRGGPSCPASIHRATWASSVLLTTLAGLMISVTRAPIVLPAPSATSATGMTWSGAQMARIVRRRARRRARHARVAPT